jgi:predicted DNA-binding protein (UPF0251 family)
MGRPRKPRTITKLPPSGFYKPEGIDLHRMQGTVLPIDGFEALRLADAEGLAHHLAAEKMGVSRATFSRILNHARHVVAKALTNGWAIRIDQ